MVVGMRFLILEFAGVRWVSGSGPGRKRIRLNRKTSAQLVGLLIHSRPLVWKTLRHVVFFRYFHA